MIKKLTSKLIKRISILDSIKVHTGYDVSNMDEKSVTDTAKKLILRLTRL